jgi:hypothetical protein
MCIMYCSTFNEHIMLIADQYYWYRYELQNSWPKMMPKGLHQQGLKALALLHLRPGTHRSCTFGLI